MPTYELMALLREGLDKKDKEEVLATVKEVLGQEKGKIIKENSLGKKRLAYTIDRETEAEYYLFEFESSQDSLDPLNQKLRLKDAVLRYLLVRKD